MAWGAVMNRIAVVSLLALAPALAHADSVFLKGGGEVKGEIVEQRADAVVLEVGPGRLTLPMRNVVRIVSNETDLGRYHARAAALAAGDVAGWLDLALWAQSRDLATQARDAYEHVLGLDPRNSAAHLGLGDVRVGERWMSATDANRARGLVEFDGMWMTPDDRQALIAERTAAVQERRAVREAEARAREAEARAREAEARAEAAAADARQAQQPPDNGIPYPWVFGPGFGPLVPGPFNPFAHVLVPGMRPGHHPGRRHDPPPAWPPAPPPNPFKDLPH